MTPINNNNNFNSSNETAPSQPADHSVPTTSTSSIQHPLFANNPILQTLVEQERNRTIRLEQERNRAIRPRNFNLAPLRTNKTNTLLNQNVQNLPSHHLNTNNSEHANDIISDDLLLNEIFSGPTDPLLDDLLLNEIFSGPTDPLFNDLFSDDTLLNSGNVEQQINSNRITDSPSANGSAQPPFSNLYNPFAFNPTLHYLLQQSTPTIHSNPNVVRVSSDRVNTVRSSLIQNYQANNSNFTTQNRQSSTPPLAPLTEIKRNIRLIKNHFVHRYADTQLIEISKQVMDQVNSLIKLLEENLNIVHENFMLTECRDIRIALRRITELPLSQALIYEQANEVNFKIQIDQAIQIFKTLKYGTNTPFRTMVANHETMINKKKEYLVLHPENINRPGPNATMPNAYIIHDQADNLATLIIKNLNSMDTKLDKLDYDRVIKSLKQAQRYVPEKYRMDLKTQIRAIKAAVRSVIQ